MKVINSGNIEKWMFDYYEGNLSLHEKLELENFVAENPIYQADFDAWGDSFIPQEEIVYGNTKSLIKKGFFDDKRIVGLFLFFALVGISALTYSSLNNNSESTGQIVNEKLNSNKELSLKNLTSSTNTNNKKLIDKIKQTVSLQLESEKGKINKKLLTENNVIVKTNSFDAHHESVNSIDEGNPSTNLLNSKGSVTKKKANPFMSNYTASNIASQVTTNTILVNDYKITAEETKQFNNEAKIERLVREKQYMISHKSYQVGEFVALNTISTINTTKKDDFSSTTITLDSKKEKGIKVEKSLYSNGSYKSKSLAKSLKQLFDKELSLTVYNNKLMLKDDLITLSVNSSFAGNTNIARIQTNFKRNFNNNSTAFSASYDTKIKGIGSGIGIVASYSKDNISEIKRAGLIYAHKVDLSFMRLVPALKGEFEQSEIKINDSTKLTSNLGIYSPSVLMEFPYAYIGFQVNNVLNSNLTNKTESGIITYGKPRSYSLVLGTDYKKSFGRSIVVSPQIHIDLYDEVYAVNLNTYNFSTTVKYKLGLFGLGYSSKDILKAAVGVDAGLFRITYNAEANIKTIKMEGTNSLTHEIGVQVLINKKQTSILNYK